MTELSIRDLTAEELAAVAGANVDWNMIGLGIGMIGLGVALVGTAGFASVPIGIFGAAFGGELFLAGTALGLGFGGGFMIGMGFCW